MIMNKVNINKGINNIPFPIEFTHISITKVIGITFFNIISYFIFGNNTSE